METHPTISLFNEIKKAQPKNRVEQAFRAFFLNGCSYMGMGLRPLGGNKQTSKGKIDSRWSSANRLIDLSEVRKLLHGRTKVLNADFEQVIPFAHAKALLFLDPPYYEAGNQLYKFKWSDADHVRLRDALKGKSNWVISYDDHPRIRELYGLLRYIMTVQYSGGRKRKKMHELLLFPAWNPCPMSTGMWVSMG